MSERPKREWTAHPQDAGHNSAYQEGGSQPTAPWPAPPARDSGEDIQTGAGILPGNDDYQQWQPPAPGGSGQAWTRTPAGTMLSRRPRRRSRAGLAALATAVIAAGAAVAVVHARHPGTLSAADAKASAGASRMPARAAMASPAAQAAGSVTLQEASRVLARYIPINNQANASFSSQELARIEGGTALQLDAGSYRYQQAAGAAKDAPFTWIDAKYYIPGQAGRPRWFMVRAQSALITASSMHPDSPPRPTGNYVVMILTQDAPGASWKEILEPGLESANPGTPPVALTAGHAVAAGSITQGLAVSPASIGQVTAAALDHGGGRITSLPTALGEQQAQSKLESSGGSGFTVTVTHKPAGPVFGVCTEGGGVILAFALYAQLDAANTSGRFKGDPFTLSIPGYYSSRDAVTSARLGYVDQILVYDPPASSGSAVRVIGAVSSIAFKGPVP